VPDIGTPAAVKRALLDARALTWAGDGASRPYIDQMLDRLGIAAAVTPKVAMEQGSGRATGRVVRGEADLVITLISEILPVTGLALAGPLPMEFQHYVAFEAALGSSAGQTESARALLTFLTGSRAREAFAARGIERP
jgi:molybdate transport system substrate-binding protein